MGTHPHYSPRRDAVPVLASLAPLLQGHVPLDRALALLLQQSGSRRAKAVVQSLAQSLRHGSSLSEAFARHETFFGSAAVAAARAGERSGRLAETLGQLAAQMGRQLMLRKRLALAMVYPVIVLLMALCGSLLILLFFVPRIQGLLVSVGSSEALPLPTRLLLGVSEALKSPAGISVIVSVFVAIAVLVASSRLRYALQPLSLQIPLLGPLMKTGALARATTSLSALLHAAVPLPEALLLSGAASGNSVVSEGFARMREDVERGLPLSQAMRLRGKLLPPDAAELALVGEETGALPEQMDLLARELETKAITRGQALLALLEPGLIILMGLLVATVVAAVFLPLVSLLNGIGG